MQLSRPAQRGQVMSSAALPQVFTVVNLDQGTWTEPRGINSAGQVTFRRSDGLGGFYDGTSVAIFSLGATTYPVAVNSAGQVTGSGAACSGCNFHAFVWAAGSGMTDLGPPYTYGASGRAINDSGQVVGAGSNYSGNHAWFWPAGTTSPAELYLITMPTDMNNAGLVAGYSNPAHEGYVWDTATSSSIDLGSSGYPFSINANGAVAGYVIGTPDRAAIWVAGARTDLGFEGEVRSWAQKLNDQKQASGFSVDASNEYHALFWSPNADGTFARTDLGAFAAKGENGCVTVSRSLNNAGHVVGTSCDSAGGLRAFAWSAADGMVDLNSRLTGAPLGLVLNEAIAINDSDAIVATSTAGLVLLKPGAPPNSPPTIGQIASTDPVGVNRAVTANAVFADVDTSDTHTAQWIWGDGTTSAALVSEASGSGSASGTHTYAVAGIYTISLTVTDSRGKSASVTKDIVVYDALAGFVTGRGSIVSPAGAYGPDPTLTGLATFAFVSKYTKGAKAPSGTTDFLFQAGKLTFFSDNYEWLVISPSRAQYKGQGTLNTQTGYQFLLTAIDGDTISKGTPDRFRIKIWHHDNNAHVDVIDYDNQGDAGAIGTTGEGTPLVEGSIVLHR